jgi:tetratricopeptide (TPR) repeat protein
MRLITGSRASSCAALLFACALGSSAAAQSSAAAAEALFEKGLSAMQAGRFDEACPALAESYRLDPRPGGLFTLAECENKSGRVATAAAHYQDYLRLVEKLPAPQRGAQKAREKVSREQLAALEPRVPKLTIQLAEGTPEGATVFLGKLELGQPSLGVALPIDPGKHVVRLEMAGRSPTVLDVVLAEGEAKSVELELGALPSEEAAPQVPVGPPEEVPPSGGSGSALTPLGLVVGGVGVAGLIVGGVTGALVFAQKSTVDEHCVGNVCNQEGLDATETASTFGLVSTVGFIAGGALVTTGLVLLLVDGSSDSQEAAKSYQLVPYASPEGAGLGFGMRF